MSTRLYTYEISKKQTDVCGACLLSKKQTDVCGACLRNSPPRVFYYYVK